MPEEASSVLGSVSPGELQPLLHSTSDSVLRRRIFSPDSGPQYSSQASCHIDMEAGVAGAARECDTDSNKTEVRKASCRPSD